MTTFFLSCFFIFLPEYVIAARNIITFLWVKFTFVYSDFLSNIFIVAIPQRVEGYWHPDTSVGCF